MMDELQLDKAAVSTLMPFPGTALFKQVVKDKLFIRNWIFIFFFTFSIDCIN